MAYNYMSGLYLLASVCGSVVGSLLLSNHVYILNALSVLGFALAVAIAGFIPSQLGRQRLDDPSLEHSASNLLAADDPESPTKTPRATKKLAVTGVVVQSWQSSFQAIITLFNVPNPTFTIIVIFLINGLASRVEVLLSQYTSLVLHWSLARVNAALALKALVSSLWLFALPTLRKRYLEPRMSTAQIDLFITQASLFTNAVGMIGLSFAATEPLFILALCIYTSGMGLTDSLTALGTLTLPPGEEVSVFY
ncbi:MAG: hypothetical protein Q9217_004928, partial [Psora testacea]